MFEVPGPRPGTCPTLRPAQNSATVLVSSVLGAGGTSSYRWSLSLAHCTPLGQDRLDIELALFPSFFQLKTLNCVDFQKQRRRLAKPHFTSSSPAGQYGLMQLSDFLDEFTAGGEAFGFGCSCLGSWKVMICLLKGELRWCDWTLVITDLPRKEEHGCNRVTLPPDQQTPFLRVLQRPQKLLKCFCNTQVVCYQIIKRTKKSWNQCIAMATFFNFFI